MKMEFLKPTPNPNDIEKRLGDNHDLFIQTFIVINVARRHQIVKLQTIIHEKDYDTSSSISYGCRPLCMMVALFMFMAGVSIAECRDFSIRSPLGGSGGGRV